MKKQKMSLSNIKDVLGRDEMRQIMAGSGGGQAGCDPPSTCCAPFIKIHYCIETDGKWYTYARCCDGADKMLCGAFCLA